MFEQMNNNKVHLKGKILSKPVFSHQVYDETFFEVNLEVPRLSDSVDVIPITISSKLINDYELTIGKEIEVNGQFRSYNKQVDGKSKLVLTVFAREIFIDNISDENPNIIELVGFICKEPVFRTTPFKREICDILLAVNRAYNKSDYLPCIAWGRNARFAKNIEIGQKISVVGRIQSRNYEKKLESGEFEKRVAYEISITRISNFDDGKEEIIDGAIISSQLKDTTNFTGV